MLNQITIMGRLTREPEIRQTQSQIPVASFSLAVERDYKAEGSDSREVDFINCVAWRHTAEFVQKFFAKGSAAIVTGRLQMRNWEDKDGNKRISAEVVANSVYFGESKRDKADNQASNAVAGGNGYNSGNGAGNRDKQRERASQHSHSNSSGFSDLEDINEGELPF